MKLKIGWFTFDRMMGLTLGKELNENGSSM